MARAGQFGFHRMLYVSCCCTAVAIAAAQVGVSTLLHNTARMQAQSLSNLHYVLLRVIAACGCAGGVSTLLPL